IVWWANGYWPDFTYQRLPFDRFDWTLCRETLQMFTAQVSYFFGNAPFIVVCAVGVAFCLGRSRREWWKPPDRAVTPLSRLVTSDVFLVLLASSGALIVLIGLMIMRHPPVFGIPDHALWYYTLPIHAATLFGATLLASQATGAAGVWETRARHV